MTEWHERYRHNPRPFGEEPTPFLREVMADPAAHRLPSGSLRILCPGDGYGRNGLWLARQGHCVVGFDVVDTAVTDAQAAALADDLAYAAVVADAARIPFPLPFPGPFDLVALIWLRLPTLEDRRACAAECARLLRPGGVVIIVSGQRVTTPAEEQELWSSQVDWADHSTDEEVRLLGRTGPGA
ncbi:methyltransferase domain-containing protein [Brachybacterium sp. Marseille-Q7125]|uniref:methyltransferase domain-containing protein n=1 Tax=Brachybacterium sp. Marseille-Q7125 TaxID=2932815 RepID=UPI001FF15EBD|nr:methyltransferase domain-containing protein [Brachybacterium sp. Marseille-Q7125]